MGATERIAKYAVELRFEELPAEVVTRAKLCVVDWLGACIAGAEQEPSRLVREVVMAGAGQAQATLLGTGDRASAEQAALANAFASSVLEFDDVHLGMLGHPTAPVLPAVLAVAEWKGLSGRQVLTALVAGIEVECGISPAVNPAHYESGWYATSTLGHFGAAAGVASLLDMPVPQAEMALSLAGQQAAGTLQVFGTMSKSLVTARAAANGLTAAFLAGKGFTCGRDVLEGKFGFGQMYSPKLDAGRLGEALGSVYEMRNVLFKRYASSRGTHPTIEAMAAVGAQSGVKAEEVVSATAHVNRTAFIADGRIREPSVGLEGKLCLAYCAALGFIEGKAGEREFRDDMVARPDLKRFTRLMELIPEDDLTLDQARVIVRTADGREHHAEVDMSTPVPLEVEQARVEEKFRGLMEGRLSADRASAALQMIASLETVQPIDKLIEALVS